MPVSARASSAAPGSVTPRVGDRLGPDGRFELLEKLGTGGMGVVFRAHDRQLDRAVAVKFVRPARLSWEQLVEQLTQEAKANAKLNHENIVALFDLDTWNGAPFLVMELLQGRSLRELLAQERLSAERAIAIAIDVARGLAHAHRNGVVHRDLKPSNVFILPDGRAKVLDFGLARSSGAESGLVDGGLFDDETALTGTPAYMSPEQWRREAQDGRADVWAMGVLLHEMLVGAVPFSATELRRFLLPGPLPHLPIPSVRAHRAELPQEADRVLGRALTAAPQERYQSADEMLAALVALQAQLKAPQDGKSPARPRAEAERRLLTLLCCTLARAPASDEDEEDEALRAFHQLCADTLEHFEGTLATSVSGQVLACFGYPQVDEEDAVRAVRAALAIVEAGNAQSPPLEIQVGLHSGPVVVQTRQGVPALQGEAPGLATWLATWKGPQRVRMSERTSQLVPGMFQLQPLPGLGTPPEGKPLVAFEVAGERLITSRFKQAAVTELSPLVGREQELLRLVELWEEAKRGHGQFVLVSGDPGLGKSRVVHELIHRLGEETTHFVAQCWSQFRHSPFYPIIDLQYRALGLRKVDAPEAKLRRLEEVLSRHLGSPAEYVPLWASLMSVPLVPPYQDRALPPEQEKTRTLEAFSRLLMRLAEQRPVLVVLEDVHWVDHSTLELVNLLFRQVANARVLMVLTFRPEFRPPWPQAPHLHRISLDRLPSEVAARMVRESARLLQPELVSQLVSRADGIPLYLEQLARTVLEAGSPRALDIPDSLQDLLMARLDRLSSLAKDAAQLASVIGREFSWNMLRRLW
ncbi:MAG TPA: protein kinase, partial [Myxococcaceae bacterium]|nr:protein kinase [Myxococcaceae bacterium]